MAQNGIDTLFKVLGQISASTAVMALAPYVAKQRIVTAIVTYIFAVLLFSLAFINGIARFWIPLLKCIYGPNEKFSEMEVFGLKYCFRAPYLIYMLGSMSFFFLVHSWVETIIATSVR